MAPKSKKPSAGEPNPPDRSLKKYLAVATMAASLGVSLGVPVGDALAQDERLSSPPGYTLRDRQKEAMDQLELSTQSDKEGLESSQVKIKSRQTKLNSLESRQGKFKNMDSTQIKIDKQADTDINAEQVLGNE